MFEIPWLDVSRIVLLTQALFIGAYGAFFALNAPLGRCLFAFGVCAACEIVLRFEWQPGQLGWLYYGVILGTSALPAVIWLITRYVFDDDFKVRASFWIFVVVYLCLNLVGRLADSSQRTLAPVEQIFFYYVPQLAKLGFAVHIIAIAVLGIKADLVEQRRRLRAPVALAAGILVSAGLGSQLLNRDFRIEIAGGIELFLNLALAYGITLTLFRIKFPIVPAGTLKKPSAKPGSAADGADKIKEKLTRLMFDEKYFLQPGVTIGSLAEALSEPEYKVRRVINGNLGFRNFNQYINSLRVKVAETKLRESDASVLSIAKELGYLSLSSFNKAFREIHPWTPSEYRAQHRNKIP